MPNNSASGDTNWVYAEKDRMTEEEAAQACRTFEFDEYMCLGTVDLTDPYGSWGLKIAPRVNPGAWAIYTATEWWLWWNLMQDIGYHPKPWDW